MYHQRQQVDLGQQGPDERANSDVKCLSKRSHSGRVEDMSSTAVCLLQVLIESYAQQVRQASRLIPIHSLHNPAAYSLAGIIRAPLLT